MTFIAVQKGIFGGDGVGCQLPWGCISEDWVPLMDTQYRHLPRSFCLHPLPHGSSTDRLTQTQAAAQRLLVLPAHWRHVNPLTYLGHWQKFIRRHFKHNITDAGIREPVSDESEWGGGSPWFPSWEILIRCFLLSVCVGRRKVSSGANLFFALVIESGKYCYQNAIH